jgi:hypothetical protein
MRHTLPLGLVLVLALFWPRPALAAKLHVKYGYAIEVEHWWPEGALIYFVRPGGDLREVISRADVERFEGRPSIPDDLMWDAAAAGVKGETSCVGSVRIGRRVGSRRRWASRS